MQQSTGSTGRWQHFHQSHFWTLSPLAAFRSTCVKLEEKVCIINCLPFCIMTDWLVDNPNPLVSVLGKALSLMQTTNRESKIDLKIFGFTLCIDCCQFVSHKTAATIWPLESFLTNKLCARFCNLLIDLLEKKDGFPKNRSRCLYYDQFKLLIFFTDFFHLFKSTIHHVNNNMHLYNVMMNDLVRGRLSTNLIDVGWLIYY